MRHVKESSGRQPERGIGRGIGEACEFEPLEHEENSLARGKRSKESKFGPEWCPSSQPETVCVGHCRWPDTLKRGNRTIRKPQTPGNRGDETNFQLNPQLEKQSAKGRGSSLGRRKIEFHNMQISDSGYLEKVVKNLKNKVNIAEGALPLGIQAHETNILIWSMFTSA